jgi:hypothetical protein
MEPDATEWAPLCKLTYNRAAISKHYVPAVVLMQKILGSFIYSCKGDVTNDCNKAAKID